MFKIILNLIRKPLAAAIYQAINAIPIAADVALFKAAVVNEVARVLGVPPPAQ